MIAIIDNYDSFTYNIYQYLAQLTDVPIEVFRNNRITVEELQRRKPTQIIISPGPGTPADTGVSCAIVRAFAGQTPILGICLGMQVIASVFGAKIVAADAVMHGKAEQIRVDQQGLFRTLDSHELCMRYHSLAIDPETLPAELIVTARAEDGEIMGIRHTKYVCEGVQFHPESIGTSKGIEMLRNFLHYRRERFPYSALLTAVQNGAALSTTDAGRFMDELTDGNLNDAQIAGFLVAINSKGIAIDEIVGCAEVLRRKCRPALKGAVANAAPSGTTLPSPLPLLDTCGTGGDGLGTFNISSMSALLVASCGGVQVAKHGNRAVSSRAGSAEFFQQLGIPLEINATQAKQLLVQYNFCFFFAPRYHSALRFAVAARRALGVKTILNVLGPLANPARATHQLIGVFDAGLLVPMARAAHRLGVQEVMVVHGEDGQDEISISGPTNVARINSEGDLQEYRIEPQQYGFQPRPLAELIGGDAAENATLARELMAGGGREALRDAVILNAAAALALCTPAITMEQAVEKCRSALQSGAVAERLQAIVATTAMADQNPY